MKKSSFIFGVSLGIVSVSNLFCMENNENNKLMFNTCEDLQKPKQSLGEISAVYRVEKDQNNLQILGETFLNNNKCNIKAFINNKHIDLIKEVTVSKKDFISFEKDENISNYLIKQGYIKIGDDKNYDYEKKLNGNYNFLVVEFVVIKNITNPSYMFSCCKSLITVKGINNLVSSTDMDSLFSGCKSLISLPDISKWDTSNVINMNWLFSGCESLISLPDISKWDTSNVTNMNWLFYKCESLISLPDISKWNTSNVKYMSCLFCKCSSLISLPDISKWDTKNVKYMSCLFSGCKSLISLPDISKWNTKNVKYMSCLFYCCKSLSSLPDISEWNTKNITNMVGLFYGCSSLTSLPDISKWETTNVEKIFNGGMFFECISLASLPNITSLKNLLNSSGYESVAFKDNISSINN